MAVVGELPIVTEDTVTTVLSEMDQLEQDPDMYFMKVIAGSNPVLFDQIEDFALSQPSRNLADVAIAAAVTVFALLEAQARYDDAERDM